MECDVRLEQAQEIPTAVVRLRATFAQLAKVVPEACGQVWKVIQAQKIPGAGRHVALYRDDAINLEVGVEMAQPFARTSEVIASSLPPGRVATAVHMGPYQQLHFAHVAIRDWCKKQGHALAGPNWEIYGHWDQSWNKDPSQIRTDVFYLLK
jgi:effector-binding domain-containing protein